MAAQRASTSPAPSSTRCAGRGVRRAVLDPDDDYLIALAHSQNAVLVSGDSHLLDLSGGAPILSPADFLAPQGA